jgi:hypothetical protein
MPILSIGVNMVSYYFFYMEIALRKKNDLKIYAYENVSHIPTRKLVEIFGIDLEKDPYLLDGYFLTEESYAAHEAYITGNIGEINLKVFEYTLRQYVANDFTEVRKLYKESLME